MNDRPVPVNITIILHLHTMQNKGERTIVHSKVSGNLQTVFPIIAPEVAEKLKEQQ